MKQRQSSKVSTWASRGCYAVPSTINTLLAIHTNRGATHTPSDLLGASCSTSSTLSPLYFCRQPSLSPSLLMCPTKAVQLLIHVQLCNWRHATYLGNSQIPPFILEEEKYPAQHRWFHFLLHWDTCSYLLNGFIRCFKSPDV